MVFARLYMFLFLTHFRPTCSRFKLLRFCTLLRKSRRFIAREQKLVYSITCDTILNILSGGIYIKEPFTNQRKVRTSETRYHRRTNNWQGHTRTQKNTYMNNTDSIKTWIKS